VQQVCDHTVGVYFVPLPAYKHPYLWDQKCYLLEHLRGEGYPLDLFCFRMPSLREQCYKAAHQALQELQEPEQLEIGLVHLFSYVARLEKTP